MPRRRVLLAILFASTGLTVRALPQGQPRKPSGIRALHAQTIRGTVRAAGKPIAGVPVRLLELNLTERTGDAGDFAFLGVPAGVYRLAVRVTGYRAITDTVRAAGNVTTVTLDLAAEPVVLDEIVVSASPTPRPTSELYQAASSKSRADLATSSGTTLAERISDLPGVSVRGLGSAPSRPILRGLGDNEVALLENGLRVGDLATFDPAHATPIDALTINQVDVVRGPATILYGPNTIGGVVNVITSLVPMGSSRQMSGTIALEGNSVSNLYSGYVEHLFSNAGSALRLSASGVHASDIRIPAGTYVDPGTGAPFDLNRLPQTFDHSSALEAGYSYSGSFGSLGIGARHYNLNYGIPGVPPNPDWLNGPPTTSRIAQVRNTVELRSRFVARGPFRSIGFNASYNDYSHSEFPTAQDASGVSDPQANHFHKREFNGVLQLQQPDIGRLSGTVGIWTDVQDLTIEGDQPLGPNSVTKGLAVYGYEELRVGSRTRLQAGLRYDLNHIQTRPDPSSSDPVFRSSNESRSANAVTASAGLQHRFSNQVTSSISVGRSFRAPTVQELFANGLDAASGTYSIGTATLKPETGLGIDASLSADFGRARIEVSPYLNYIKDYIYGFLRGDTIQDFPVRQFTATKARLYGFEASTTIIAAPWLTFRASGDYVNAQDTRNAVPLPFTPPLRGLVRVTFQQQHYFAMAEGRFAASQTRLGEGDTPTDGYAVMNVGVGLRLVHGARESLINLVCSNLFNRVYRDNLSVIKDFLPQPARGVRLSYQLSY